MATTPELDHYAFLKNVDQWPSDSPPGASDPLPKLPVLPQKLQNNAAYPTPPGSVQYGKFLTIPAPVASLTSAIPKRPSFPPPAPPKNSKSWIRAEIECFTRIPYPTVTRPAKPITTETNYQPPGFFTILVFESILHTPAIHFSLPNLVDAIIETEFFGIRYRLTLDPAFLDHHASTLPIPIKRGTRIVFRKVESCTTTYIVTWKRGKRNATTLLQVDAFNHDQSVHPPLSNTWPSLLLVVPTRFVASGDHETPSAPIPLIPRPPTLSVSAFPTPTGSEFNLLHPSARAEMEAEARRQSDLEVIQRLPLYQIIWTKLTCLHPFA